MSGKLTPVIPSLYGLTYYELPLGPFQGQNRSDYKMSFDQLDNIAKESAGSGLTRERNYTQRLNDEVRSLEERLKRKKRLKQLLEENPIIREALELMN